MPTTGIVKFKYNKVHEGALSSLTQYILANNNYTATSHMAVS